jgi:uncharacterized protein DUF4115
MRTDEAHAAPFDEQAALEELERLRDAIQETRRQRRQRSDEFDAFVRSFRTPPPTATPRGTDVVEHGRDNDPHRAASPVVEQQRPIEPAAQMEQPLPAEQPAPPQPVVTSAPPPKRRRRALLPRALGGAAILVASVALLIRPWKGQRSETATSSPGGATTTASAPSATPSVPAAVPAPPPAAGIATAHALEGELNVQRQVWVRVLVDGQRTIERELPAGTRVPLHADRAIVIRAGDAGAVRLTINGVDRGPLGKDAEIVTRTFTAPGNPAR